MTHALRTLVVFVALPGLAFGGIGQSQTTNLVPTVPPLDIDPAEELARLHELTPEMQEWLDDNVPPGINRRHTLNQLLSSLQSDRLGLEYSHTFTGTAREVFEQKTFNCLSFAHLFIAMARQRDVDAYYYSVIRPDRYGREGDLVLVSEHVTGAYGSGSNQLTLRFAFDEVVDYSRGFKLSDREALALHYSNLGTNHLIEGRTYDAVATFKTATRLYPRDGSLWVNLGVGLRRIGDFEGAEEAYLQASRVEPGHLPAYHNLHALMVSLGRANVARELIDLLDQRANRNPYTYLNLGDSSLAQHRFDEAYRFYRRALVLGARADARAAMGSLALARGDEEGAQRWLTKAQAADARRLEETASYSPRVVALARQLASDF